MKSFLDKTMNPDYILIDTEGSAASENVATASALTVENNSLSSCPPRQGKHIKWIRLYKRSGSSRYYQQHRKRSHLKRRKRLRKQRYDDYACKERNRSLRKYGDHECTIQPIDAVHASEERNPLVVTSTMSLLVPAVDVNFAPSPTLSVLPSYESFATLASELSTAPSAGDDSFTAALPVDDDNMGWLKLL